MKRLTLFLAALLLAACAQTMQKPDPEQRERAKAHTQLGGGYYSQGMMGVALDEFNEAVQIDPGYAPAHMGVGLVRAALGQDDLADAAFKRALKLDPESSEAHNNYGTFLCARNRIDESVREFMAAVQNPLYATPELAYLNAGICTLKKQDIAAAQTYLNKAVELRPNLAQAWYELASLSYLQGNTLQARKQLARAMESVEATPQMLWLGVRIERILGDKDAEASYALLLRHKYPQSEQTKALLSE